MTFQMSCNSWGWGCVLCSFQHLYLPITASAQLQTYLFHFYKLPFVLISWKTEQKAKLREVDGRQCSFAEYTLLSV